NEVRLLARLVTDFMNFARPQQINVADVQLQSVVEESVTEIEQQLQQAGITLRIEGHFATLPGDESLLRRAFVNLLRNAAEAIDPQSEKRLIVITGAIDEGRGKRYAHVRIRDTGTGISQEDLNRVFIPFFTTKSRGYGIGLALVQKLLVAHGGSVAVERSDRTGTTFHCRLPLSGAPLPVEM
ncbi:MAG TPA: ATP-binding protein, partial [Blastocatellia bacterium]|nr:ATP-binding protein [Blastocatellia bacterium]